METYNLELYRQMMDTRAAEMAHALRQAEITAETVPDAMNETALSAERDWNAMDLDHRSTTLRQIRAALDAKYAAQLDAATHTPYPPA